MIKFFLLLFSLLIIINPLYSDDYAHILPEEYDKNEFPVFLNDLRRAEIILLGSYPFAILFTKIGLDLADYAKSGFDRNSAPSLFGGSSKQPQGNSETKKILLTSLYVSAAIAVTDYFIGKYRNKKINETERNN